MDDKFLKDTLNMPKTKFDMRANLTKKEPQFRKRWDEMNLAEKMLEKNKNNQTFILHDGPPYANGSIHIGHALNKILKDIIVRYKTLRGFYSPYVPGWDTHGLPIEHKMLSEAKLNHKNIDAVELRKKAAKYANKQVEHQIKQFKHLQLATDFKKIYLTKDKTYETEQLRVFKKMLLDGLIYKGLKPVFWSPSSQTALAEAEVEYKDIQSPSIFVSFKISKNNGTKKIKKDDNLIIWTTTPWTLLANSGVAVGERIQYCRFEADKKGYIVAKDLYEKVIEECNFKKPKIISEFNSDELLELKYISPLNKLECPVVLGHHVSIETGSGLVHIAPLFGEDDFQIGTENSLEKIMHLDDGGVITKDGGKYAGQFYAKANKNIINDLKTAKLLLADNEITHSYPHDWRTHQPILFRGTPQWFVSIEKIKVALLNEVEKIKTYPEWAKKRLTNMIADRKDWTISRQRTWGVPIIIFYDKDYKPVVNEKILDHVIKLVEEHGTDIWWEKEADELLPKEYKNKGYTKEMDIMDVWFDSGCSFTSVEVGEKIKPPFDLYLEGSDQYRGWFNSSLINSVAYTTRAPYKQIVSHGFVLDTRGDKMSKSKGNVLDPIEVVKKHGADILRLWVANSEYTSDVNISNDILKQTSEGYRKIRNTIKFILGNLHSYKYDPSLIRTGVHEFIHEELLKVSEEVYKAYDEYKFQTAIKLINNYAVELSSFYLNISKDILYIHEKDSKERQMILLNLYEIADFLIKAIAPIMPTTAEDAYMNFNKVKKCESVHLETIKEPRKFNEKVLKEWEEFFKLRDEINIELENAIKDNKIKRTNEAKLVINTKSEFIKGLDLKQLLMVGLIEFGPKTEVSVFKSKKCRRCWNHFLEGQIVNELCQMCKKIVDKFKAKK